MAEGKQPPEGVEREQEIEPELRENMRSLAKAIDEGMQEQLGVRIGFVLAMFKFGETGRFNYISNASREDVTKLMREMAVKFEAEQAARLAEKKPRRRRKGKRS